MANLADNPKIVDRLSMIFHAVYQKEARKQGDVRHKDCFDVLPENIKEFDRVLARYVLEAIDNARKTNPYPDDIFVGITEEGKRGSAMRYSWNLCCLKLEDMLLEGDLD